MPAAGVDVFNVDPAGVCMCVRVCTCVCVSV